jgi:hypothetical protein
LVTGKVPYNYKQTNDTSTAAPSDMRMISGLVEEEVLACLKEGTLAFT